MEKRNKQTSNLFIWGLFAALSFHNLVVPVVSNSKFEAKTHKHFSHPRSGTPPQQGSVSACKCAPPSHGTSPSHGSPPPRPRPRPSHGISPPYGGGHRLPCTPPPSPPRGPLIPPVIGTPATPIVGAPSTPFIGTPTTPIVGAPGTPIIGTPTTPTISTPVIPGDPHHFPVPTPPFLPDPTTPSSGTCEFWRTHPSLIWGLYGWWATVGDAFGMSTVPGSISAGPNLLEALSNTKSDGLSALYREGTASLLNSMVNQRFHFTSKQVKDRFIAVHGSEKAAMAQAQIFKLANEGQLKPRT